MARALLRLAVLHGIACVAGLAYDGQLVLKQALGGDGFISPFGEPLLLVVLSTPPPPEFFSNMTNYLSLQGIMIDTSELTSSPHALPTEFGLFCNLKIAFLRRTFFGTLPTELGQLSKLQLLDLTHSRLAGSIPSQIGLAPLFGLFLHDNELESILPTELGNTPLGFLRVQSNRLSGPLPSQLFTLPFPLSSVDASNTELEGPLPSELWRAVNLAQLIVSQSRLAGTLSSQIGRFRFLRTLDVHDTLLGGSLPSQLGLLTDMREAVLYRARFTGTVPSEIALLQNLYALELHTNQFSGPLPSQLGLMHRLTLLDLHGNSFSGTIPRELLAGLTNLHTVRVGNNNFEGSVPEQYRKVWLQDCDHSGLVSPECEMRCASCARGELEIRACDSRGNPPSCLPVYAIVVGTVGVAALVVVAVVFLNPGLSRREVAKTAVSAVYSVADMVTDVLFAISAPGVIQVLSATMLALLAVSVVTWTTWVLRSTGEARSPVHVVAACFVGVFTAASLQSVVQSFRAQELVAQAGILLAVAEGVVQGVLQLVALGGDDISTVTVIALAFSVTTVASLSAVFGIIRLSQRDLPKSRRTREALGKETELGAVRHADSPSRAHGADDPNGPKSDGGEGTRQAKGSRKRLVWKRFALGSLCCCVVAASIASSSDPRQTFPVTTQVEHRSSVSASSEIWRQRASQRSVVQARGESVRAWRKLAECPSGTEYISADLPLLSFLNVPLVLIFITSTEDSIREYVQGHAQTVQLLVVSEMEGSVPSEVGLMTRLVYLGVEGGRGQLPTQIGQLANLDALVFELGNFEGEFVSELGRLATLSQFRCSAGLLEGSIPSELALPSLRTLELRENTHLSGYLPLQFFALDQIGLFRLTDSPGVVVRLQSDVGQMRGAETFHLGRVQLEGTLPSELANLSAIKTFSVTGCGLKGEFVVHRSWAGTLENLILSKNLLSGTLPSELGWFVGLNGLDVSDNLFSGPLPTQLGLLTELRELFIYGNRLTGTIPSQLGLLTALTDVRISNNSLEGGLPDTIPLDLVSVWLSSCGGSGVVVGRHCARDCPGCPFGGVQLVGCKEDGFDNVCLPLWGLLLLGLMAVGVVGMTVKKISIRQLGARTLVLLTLVSSTNAFHWLVDVAFAIDSTGPIRTISLCVVGFSALARFVTSTAEFLRMQQLGRQADITSRYFVFALAIMFCILDPFTLRVVTSQPSPSLGPQELGSLLQERRSLKLRLVCLVVMSDLPQLCLQAIRLSANASNSLVVMAVAMTSLSLAIASFELRNVLWKQSKKVSKEHNVREPERPSASE